MTDPEFVITWIIAPVLIVTLVGLYRLKRTHHWDGWRQGVMQLFGRSLGAVGWFLSRKIPWRPVLIWGPWVVMIVVLCGYGFENWRGARAWERVEQKVAARGESLVVDDCLPRGIPDEENIAKHPAMVYILANLGEAMAVQRVGIAGLARDWERPWWDPAQVVDVRYWLDPPLTSGTGDEAARRILGLAAARYARLDGLVEALERPAFQAELARDPWDLPDVPEGVNALYYGTMENLQSRAMLCARTGQADICARSLVANISLAQRAFTVFHLTSGYYRMHASWQVGAGLWDVLPLGVLDDGQLLAIDEALAETDLREVFNAMLRGERAYLTQMVDYGRAHRDKGLDLLGREGFCFSGVSSLSEFWESLSTGCRELWFLYGPAGAFDISKARAADRVTRFLEKFEGASDRELAEMAWPRWVEAGPEPPDHLAWELTHTSDATPARALATLLLVETQLVMARAAVALERHYLRHGNYPARGGDLVPEFLPAWPVDAVVPGPLVYELKSDGTPCLFSPGLDWIPGTRDDFLWHYTETVPQVLLTKKPSP